MALVGVSGCGKSTALRIASGLLFPDHGRLLCDGIDITTTPPHKRQFGMVSQQNALTPRRNAGDHIALPLRFRGETLEDIDRRVHAEAHRFSIEHLLTRRRRHLSGGEVQAVQLARALVARPSVLLLDEPLARIDLDLRLKLRADIARVRTDFGLTTLLVTADQEDALVLADRVAVIDQGQLQQVGPPLEVYDQPVNVTVARFLGEPAMNIFETPVTVVAGVRSYHVGSATFPAHPAAAERFVGGRALVGIRPESIRLSAPGTSGQTNRAPLLGDVVKTELRGSSTVVHVQIGSTPLSTGQHPQLCAVVAGIGPRVGDTVEVTIDPSRFHLFDRYTEAALHHPV